MKPTRLKLDDVKDFVPFPGYHGKMVHTDLMTIGHWTISANHSIPNHSHPHQQVVNVISGEFELTVDGTPHHMRAGDVFIIPGDVPHSGRSITDCYLIDVWHPAREDYKV
ncbi:MAG: cupin domain-containing protein [Pirellulaceae bacterium]